MSDEAVSDPAAAIAATVAEAQSPIDNAAVNAASISEADQDEVKANVLAEVAAEGTSEKKAEEAAVEAGETAQVAKDGDNGHPEPLLKTTARIDHTDYKKNRKFDPSIQPVTDNPDKIRNQVRSLRAVCQVPAHG